MGTAPREQALGHGFLPAVSATTPWPSRSWQALFPQTLRASPHRWAASGKQPSLLKSRDAGRSLAQDPCSGESAGISEGKSADPSDQAATCRERRRLCPGCASQGCPQSLRHFLASTLAAEDGHSNTTGCKATPDRQTAAEGLWKPRSNSVLVCKLVC